MKGLPMRSHFEQEGRLAFMPPPGDLSTLEEYQDRLINYEVEEAPIVYCFVDKYSPHTTQLKVEGKKIDGRIVYVGHSKGGCFHGRMAGHDCIRKKGEWHYTDVLVIPCETAQEARDLEKRLIDLACPRYNTMSNPNKK